MAPETSLLASGSERSLFASFADGERIVDTTDFDFWPRIICSVTESSTPLLPREGWVFLNLTILSVLSESR